MMKAVCKVGEGMGVLTGILMYFDEGGNESDGLSHLLGL